MGLEIQKPAGKLLKFELPRFGRDSNMDALRSSLRILIVDDNPAHRDILNRYLDHWGIRNENAWDGPTALRVLREAAAAEEAFDIAILDLAMPGMNGLVLADEIGADESLSSTNLVLLTAFDQPGQAYRAQSAGFSAYLTKPVRHSLLLSTIDGILDESKSEDGASVGAAACQPKAASEAALLANEE